MKTLSAAVIGGGSWGTAIAYLLSQGGCDVTFWMRNADTAAEINQTRLNSRYSGDMVLAENIRATTDLEEAVRTNPLIFLVVTSASARQVLHDIGPFLNGSHVLVHCIKGFEHSTYKRISTIIREETCCRKMGVLSGPNLAKEILQNHPGATVIASPYEEVVRRVQEVMITSRFRVYGHRDVTGVEIAGALKNIIALASGMSNGLGFQHNTQSLLLTRGLVEITRFGLEMGSQASTFRGLAGMGDLIATCSSQLSRNYQVGYHLAKGEGLSKVLSDLGYVAEGVPTTRSVYYMSRDKGISMPITEAIFHILEGHLSPRKAIETLMTKEYKYEEEFPG